jgi:mRNA interferase RelE/StbE
MQDGRNTNESRGDSSSGDFSLPEGCRKLKGEEDVYRVRKGNYRIIYEVTEKKLIVLVLKIGHRKDIYKK